MADPGHYDRCANRLSGALAYILLSGVDVIVWAWTTTSLWAWFVASTFGLPMLNWPQAIGMALVVTLFKGVPLDQPTESMAEHQCKSVLFSLITLGAGWAVASWWLPRA